MNSANTKTKIIIGLGNPGEKYSQTRHNAGFMAVDKIKQIKKLRNWKLRTKLKAKIIKTESLFLAKPQTFMNNSGLAVQKISQYFNISISQCLKNLYVIHDDLDISLGDYKIQYNRGSAGHKGVQSIIDSLGTKKFWRVRIGVDNRGLNDKSFIWQSQIPSGGRVLGKDYVLERFTKKEKKIIEEVFDTMIKEFLFKLKTK